MWLWRSTDCHDLIDDDNLKLIALSQAGTKEADDPAVQDDVHFFG